MDTLMWLLGGGDIYDLVQNRRVEGASAEASVARDRAMAAQDRVRELESRLENVVLLMSAQWSLLQERLGVTDEELLARVAEIRAKFDAARADCAQCHRPMQKNRKACLYCGSEPVSP